jgi:hypothetical protein
MFEHSCAIFMEGGGGGLDHQPQHRDPVQFGPRLHWCLDIKPPTGRTTTKHSQFNATWILYLTPGLKVYVIAFYNSSIMVKKPHWLLWFLKVTRLKTLLNNGRGVPKHVGAAILWLYFYSNGAYKYIQYYGFVVTQSRSVSHTDVKTSAAKRPFIHKNVIFYVK